jgi:hypothetical protein
VISAWLCQAVLNQYPHFSQSVLEGILNSLYTNPILQTCLVGAAINAAGAIAFLYLWGEERRDRYLAFWAIAFAFNIPR